ncbi:protein of unknown function [Pararobbsia alpina]
MPSFMQRRRLVSDGCEVLTDVAGIRDTSGLRHSSPAATL